MKRKSLSSLPVSVLVKYLMHQDSTTLGVIVPILKKGGAITSFSVKKEEDYSLNGPMMGMGY